MPSLGKVGPRRRATGRYDYPDTVNHARLHPLGLIG